MPGDLPGEEVIKRILALEPRAKLIAMTGYSTNPVVSDFKAYGLSDALTKPFSLDIMRSALARCLSEPPKSV
jgi:DNA-binding NtrC family response regulator